MDGGIGLASALRYRFYDQNDQKLSCIPEHMGNIKRIDSTNVDVRLHTADITLAADVDSSLSGENGCALLNGEQKGANEKQRRSLDHGLSHLAICIQSMNGASFNAVSGLGAAGGTGLFLWAFHHVTLVSGIAYLAERLHLNEEIQCSDTLISGEGSLDEQSQHGKLISYLIKQAQQRTCAIWLIVGSSTITTSDIPVERIIYLHEGDASIEEKMKLAKEDYRNLVQKLLNEQIKLNSER